MFKNILFIGAGASYAARRCCTNQCFHKVPPLGDDLLSWLKCKLTELDEISTHGPNIGDIINESKKIFEEYPNEVKYEDLLLKLYTEEKSENSTTSNIVEMVTNVGKIISKRVTLLKLLQIAFSDLSNNQIDIGFNKKSDKYDDLIRKLKIDHTWSIISLNYDTLFEEAIVRNNLNYKYIGINNFDCNQDNVTAIELLKPHGSINFIALGHNPTSTDLKILENQKQLVTNHVDGKTNHPSCFSICKNDLPPKWIDQQHFPIMAHFVDGKEAETDMSTLNSIRGKTLELIKNAEQFNITIVGVKPTYNYEHDPIVAGIFNTLYYKKCKIVFISKGKDLNDFYLRFPDAKIFDGLCEYLDALSL